LLRGLERIGAHDRFAWIVAIAVAPRRRRRWILAHQVRAVSAPEILECGGAVTAEIARIAPELAILVEILRREDVDGKRLDTLRGFARPRGAQEAVRCTARIVVVSAHRRTGHVVLVQIGDQRRAPPDAFESRGGHFLGKGQRTGQRQRRKRRHAKCAVLLSLSPLYSCSSPPAANGRRPVSILRRNAASREQQQRAALGKT